MRGRNTKFGCNRGLDDGDEHCFALSECDFKGWFFRGRERVRESD